MYAPVGLLEGQAGDADFRAAPHGEESIASGIVWGKRVIEKVVLH
jgi:hypothetical protein